MATISDGGPTISSGMNQVNGGTLHVNEVEIPSGFGPSSLATIQAVGHITSGIQGPSHGSSGMALNPGDPLVVTSVTYCYEGVISKTSGEAEIFLLSRDGNKCVFKLYYPNFKPKDDILKKLAQLNHQDIVNVLDYGYHQDRFFEIMDYAEGGTLEQYLPIKDTSRIKQIVKETVNAYHYCHNHNIIHKDIKPQNLYFKNANGTDLLVGDFGISSLLESGMSRHLTSQSLTVGYAAPEMYGLGGKVYVGKEVDYYALGITLIHLWEGKSPFDGLGIHAISNLTTSGKVHIPEEMPKEIQKLVKGLITVDYTKRWAYEEVQRWLRGEDVIVHFQVKEVNYPPYQFSASEAVITPEELSECLEKSQEKGKKQLYSNKISAWVNLFNQGLSAELDRIVEDDYPKDQDAGIQKAIYILNPDKPYISHGKQLCSAEELGDALEDNFNSYSTELKNPCDSFYLYLEAHEAKKEADTFRKYFKTFSANKALNTIIMELHGRGKVRIKGINYLIPVELLGANNFDVIKLLNDPESRVSLWLEGMELNEIKMQVLKWLSFGRLDNTTLTFALEKGSPFHFPNKDQAYSVQEFDELFAKYLVDATFVNKAVNPSDEFVSLATFWLEKYTGGTSYESRFKKYIEDNPTNPISAQLLDFFLVKLNKVYYLSEIAPIVESNYEKGCVDKGVLDKHCEIIKKLVGANPNDNLLIGFIGNKVKNDPRDPVSGQLLECIVDCRSDESTYINTITPLVELAHENRMIADDVVQKHHAVLEYLLEKNFNSKLITNYIESHIDDDVAVTLIRCYFSCKANIQTYLADITPLLKILLTSRKLKDNDLIKHHEVLKKMLTQNIDSTILTDFIKFHNCDEIAEELLAAYTQSCVQIYHYIESVVPLIESYSENKKLANLHHDFMLEHLKKEPSNEIYINFIKKHWGQPIAKAMLLEYCKLDISRDYYEKQVQPLVEKAHNEKQLDNETFRNITIQRIKKIESNVKNAGDKTILSGFNELEIVAPNHPLVLYINKLIISSSVSIAVPTNRVKAVSEYYKKKSNRDEICRWEQAIINGKKIRKPNKAAAMFMSLPMVPKMFLGFILSCLILSIIFLTGDTLIQQVKLYSLFAHGPITVTTTGSVYIFRYNNGKYDNMNIQQNTKVKMIGASAIRHIGFKEYDIMYNDEVWHTSSDDFKFDRYLK